MSSRPTPFGCTRRARRRRTRRWLRIWGSRGGRPKTWVHLARKNAASAQPTAADCAGISGTPQAQLARVQADLERVRARNQALAAENDKLAEERDILRKATKYFAAETNW